MEKGVNGQWCFKVSHQPARSCCKRDATQKLTPFDWRGELTTLTHQAVGIIYCFSAKSREWLMRRSVMLSVRFLGHLRSRLLPFVCGKHQLVSRLIAVFSKGNDLSWCDSRGLVASGSSPLRLDGLGECSRQVVLLLLRLPSRERRLLTGLQPPSASYLSFSNSSVNLTALSWVLGVRTRSSNWPGVAKAGVTSLWLGLRTLVVG